MRNSNDNNCNGSYSIIREATAISNRLRFASDSRANRFTNKETYNFIRTNFALYPWMVVVYCAYRYSILSTRIRNLNRNIATIHNSNYHQMGCNGFVLVLCRYQGVTHGNIEEINFSYRGTFKGTTKANFCCNRLTINIPITLRSTYVLYV